MPSSLDSDQSNKDGLSCPEIEDGASLSECRFRVSPPDEDLDGIMASRGVLVSQIIGNPVRKESASVTSD